MNKSNFKALTESEVDNIVAECDKAIKTVKTVKTVPRLKLGVKKTNYKGNRRFIAEAKLKAKLDKILLSRADITGDDMAKQLSPSNHYEPETNKTNENDKETEL